MILSSEQWDRFTPTKTVIVEMQGSKKMIKTPDGEKEFILIDAWDNFVDLKNRSCVVLKVPQNMGYYTSFTNNIPLPNNCIEVGDIIIPEHRALVQALDWVGDSERGNYVQIGDVKYPSIYLSEISAIIKNGILYGMPQYFIGTQVIEEKNALLQIPQKITNKVLVKALPYGYEGDVKINDVVIFDNKNNAKNVLYHIESELYRSLPDDYVRVFVDLVLAVEESV